MQVYSGTCFRELPAPHLDGLSIPDRRTPHRHFWPTVFFLPNGVHISPPPLLVYLQPPVFHIVFVLLLNVCVPLTSSVQAYRCPSLHPPQYLRQPRHHNPRQTGLKPYFTKSSIRADGLSDRLPLYYPRKGGCASAGWEHESNHTVGKIVGGKVEVKHMLTAVNSEVEKVPGGAYVGGIACTVYPFISPNLPFRVGDIAGCRRSEGAEHLVLYTQWPKRRSVGGWV